MFVEHPLEDIQRMDNKDKKAKSLLHRTLFLSTPHRRPQWRAPVTAGPGLQISGSPSSPNGASPGPTARVGFVLLRSQSALSARPTCHHSQLMTSPTKSTQGGALGRRWQLPRLGQRRSAPPCSSRWPGDTQGILGTLPFLRVDSASTVPPAVRRQ